MKHPYLLSMIAMAVSAALAGCGGADHNESTQTTLQATAIDGYLRNALVWLDVNGNNLLDSDEPNARSGEGGKVTLDVSGIENPGSYRLLVQAVAGETVDETRGAITQSFTLSAPPGVAEVTPLSTLVDQKMQQDPTLDRDAAAAAIATDLGLQPEQVLGDFIASNDIEVQVYAVNLTDQFPESLPEDPTELLNDSKELGQALDEYLEQNPVDEDTDPDSINVVVDDQGHVTPIVDQDRDGVADSEDAFPNDATETKDTDGDKVGDNSDAFPNDATESKDSDGDQVGDNSDAFPNDATESKDSDGDKVGDNSDAFPNDATETKDSDGDQVGDNSDAFPSDATESKDSDGDKVGDNSDAFPNDATETKDTDGDKVGDNSDELPLDPLRREADEVTKEEKVYTYMEDHTKQALTLKLVGTTTVSHYLDGHKEIHEQGTNYYWDSTANAIEQLNGNPLIYNEYTNHKVKQADGRFERKGWWHKDVNKDGVFSFTGETYAFGTESDSGADYWVAYDEDDPRSEGITQYINSFPRRFHDGGDLKANIQAKDTSTIDMMQHFTESTSEKLQISHFLEYKAPKDETAEPYPAPADWFDLNSMQRNPDYPIPPNGDPYAETDTHQTRDDGCTSHTEDQDWQADGTINTTTGLVNCPDGSEEKSYAKPIWANPQDDQFEEYADYNWYKSDMSSYWYEFSTKTETEDGQLVTTAVGARYLLDPTTNSRLEDDTHPDGYKFNDYTSVRTVLSPTVEMEHASWHHYHLDDHPATTSDEASFTVTSDDLGQDVKIFFKEMNDFWVGHRFAEWGSQNVTDLPGKIAALRQQGVTVDQINSSNLPGLSDYDGQLLTASFRYNADGTPRTWYWVTKLPAVTGDDTWSTWKKVPIQLVNGGLDGAGLPNWIINDAGGNLFMLQPKVAEPWGWYNAYQVWNLGVSKADGQTINPSGRVDTWAGSFFLDSAQADAELALH
ncbi:hypothetical protein [Pseudaeromonas pectinilytica]